MHCRSSRDDDILNVLNSSAVGTFTNLHNWSYVAESQAGMANLIFAIMSIFGLLSLSKRGVIASSGFMLSARRRHFACFLVYVSVAYSGGVPLAELNRFAGMHCSHEIRGTALPV